LLFMRSSQKTAMSLLIYGSYGYTGSLIVEECDERGIEPVLAGRNTKKVDEQAEEWGFEGRSFSVESPGQVAEELEDAEADAVLNCAGPFVDTYETMVEACLEAGADYLDITGEISVFEGCAEYDGEAEEAGITVVPGVGFDVVPSDCLASHLADRLEDPTYLAVALRSLGNISSGTARTVVEGIGEGSAIRRDGVVESRRMGWKTRLVDFGDGEGTVEALSVPLGDISTAYHSTGIENIEGYVAFRPSERLLVRATNLASPVLSTRPAKGVLRRVVEHLAKGPDEQQRLQKRGHVWGEVRAGDEKRVSRLTSPVPYALTAMTAAVALDRVGDADAGFQTPATAFGKEFVTEFEGVELEDIE